jgi:hypothetical protein
MWGLVAFVVTVLAGTNELKDPFAASASPATLASATIGLKDPFSPAGTSSLPTDLKDPFPGGVAGGSTPREVTTPPGTCSGLKDPFSAGVPCLHDLRVP